MKRLITALLCIAMLATASGCAATTADAPIPTTAATTTAQATSVTTTTADTTTSETPSTTTGTPETTTAPVTTDAPESTDAPTTTETPATTTVAPVTNDAPESTDTPVTTTAPVTTTEAPTTTTTTAPVTTTKAPVTTQTPVTTTKAPETKPPHTHSYSAWKTTKEATCTADGKQTRTCSCGESESKTIAATGHNWGDWVVTKKATETAEGTETKTCKATENRKIDKVAHTHTYGEWTLCDDYENETATCKSCGKTTTQTHYADPETDEQLVADRVIYYINQIRKEEGTAPATKLERMTPVAQLRSTYLIGLTSSSPYDEWHTIEGPIDAATYYKYGEKHENSFYDFETGKITYLGTYSYSPGVGEALGHNWWRANNTIDDIADAIAYQVYNSSSHWAYVGSSEYPYIAVGVSEGYGGRAYFAIWVSTTNEWETVYYD